MSDEVVIVENNNNVVITPSVTNVVVDDETNTRVVVEANNSVVINPTLNSVTVASVGLQGPAGAAGPQGPQGPAGPSYERQHDWVSNSSTSYEGFALQGTLTSQAGWTITRIIVASNGTVTVGVAYNAIWDNRYTTIYS